MGLWSLIRQPITLFDERLRALEERITAVEQHIVREIRERIRELIVYFLLVAAAAAIALVAGIYVLIGLWLSAAHFIGSIGASFLLGVVFFAACLVPLWVLHRIEHNKPKILPLAHEPAPVSVSHPPPSARNTLT